MPTTSYQKKPTPEEFAQGYQWVKVPPADSAQVWAGRGRGQMYNAAQRVALAGQLSEPLPWEAEGLSRVGRVVAFIEYLPVTKGILAGQNMRLLPDQLEFIEGVYGPQREDGRRMVTLAIKSAPKGGGKTGMAAGLALCHLLGPEAEVRGEVYSASMDRNSAAKLYREMESILVRRPALAYRVNLARATKTIEVLTGPGAGSTFEAMSADARKANGLSPSFWVYDELAQAKGRDLLDNLVEGLGKRREGLGMVISTQAPDDLHPLSQLIDDALTGADPGIYCHLICAPPDADPWSIETLKSVNPAVGIFLDLDELVRSRDRAQRLPAFESAYRNLRLNQRVGGLPETRIMTRDVWEACGGPVNRGRLAGRVCYAGLDLSAKIDLTSLTLVFPDDNPDDPTYDVLAYFWTPEGALAKRTKAEAELFRQWINAGFIEAVPGPVIKYRYMAKVLRKLRREFTIVAIAFDRWRIDDFKADMVDMDLGDLPLVPWGQGYKDMGPAVDILAEYALGRRLRHGDNPVMTECVKNAITVSDPAGNLKIDKGKSNRPGMIRVDGAVTLAMALGLAKRFVDESEEEPEYQMMVIG